MRSKPMLDLFRKRGFASVVYGAIIVATLIVFVIQFRPNSGQQVTSLKQVCAANVRGWCIDPKDLRSSYRLLMPRDAQGNLRTAQARSMGLNKIALDGLIERELLVGEAARLGITVTDDEVSTAIYQGFINVSVPSDAPQVAYTLRVGDGRVYAGFRDSKTKKFDLKTYERTVRSITGRSPTEFREEQARELLAAKVREIVRAPVRISESEAFASYVQERDTAVLQTVRVKEAYAARHAVDMSTAAVEAWAEIAANAEAIAAATKNRSDEDRPQPNHIRHILIKFPSDASPDEKKATLARIKQAGARIHAGELFAEVARDVSEDTGSASQGGDVGDHTDGFVAPFKAAADKLAPGAMTPEPVETSFGYHLITKDDPAKANEIQAALGKSVVRSLYRKAKASDAAKDIADKIASQMRSKTTAETAIAQALPKADQSDPDFPKAEITTAFTRSQLPLDGIETETVTKINAFVFDPATRDGDVYGQSIRVDDGFMVFVRHEHKGVTREDLEKEGENYAAMLLRAKKAEALSMYVKRLREEAKSEIKIDETVAREPGTGDRDGGAAPPSFEDEEE